LKISVYLRRNLSGNTALHGPSHGSCSTTVGACITRGGGHIGSFNGVFAIVSMRGGEGGRERGRESRSKTERGKERERERGRGKE